MNDEAKKTIRRYYQRNCKKRKIVGHRASEEDCRKKRKS